MADEERTGTEPSPQEGEGATALAAIVGIGVGSASLASLSTLLAGVRRDAGAAFLIATRERDGASAEAVIEAAGMPGLTVALARDGERIAPGGVYVCGTDSLLTVEDGRLRVRPTDEGHRGAIDTLLVSLADHAHERAVAVLLAGLGSEGAAGIVATKKYGGLSIAEQADGDLAAPGGADPAAVADLHVEPDRIAQEVAHYLTNLGPILREEEREEATGDVEAHVTQITTILRNVTSHDFHGYKRGTFIRRVQRRIQVMQIEGGLDAYVERLRGDREEVQHLFQDLLIGVTQFFRDPAEFEVLERELPRLFAGKEADDQFRVWVLGCATGEEAYSIAILLREHMATLDHPPEVQIFATDLDARALSIARAGRYADTIANHVRPDRLERWFVREGDTYCVSKELREMCIFSPHNIVKDAPFSRTDILSCRNLLIYLSTELQNRVIPIFHFSLRPEGVLFLGSSENVTRHTKLFAPIDRKSRVFRRLETATRIIPDFPLTPRARAGDPAPSSLSLPFEGRLPASISRQAEAVAERYAPAYVVVDTHGDVLHFSGRTGRYLEPSAGAATLNLVNLVHRDLRLDMRTALARAISEARRVEVSRLTLRQDDRAFYVTVVVEPLSSGDVTALAVLFQDGGPVVEGDGAAGDRLTSDEHVQRLESELRVTRDRLQATIEELESTNEELKSSNEEYQSINEELQSANEEMETSKEELQSVNEELQTVNGELGHRVGELGRANSDMKNLLESTQIATVFLDNELRIRNFTPVATDVFHLLETDVGRPLDHVVSRVDYPELADDVRRVLKTLVPVERQVTDPAGRRHFSARVLPYRSVDNYISGAVVTFTDLTAVHEAQAALRESDALRRIALEGGRMGTWRWDLKNRLIWGDAEFLTLWGIEPTAEALPLSLFTERMTPEGAAQMEVIADQAMKADEEFDGPLEIVAGPTAGHWIRCRGRPDRDALQVLYGVTFDITEQRRVETALRASEARYRMLFEGIDEGFCLAERVPGDAVDYRYVTVNPAFERQSGFADAVGKTLRELVPAIEEEVMQRYRRAEETGRPDRFAAHVGALDRWFEIEISPGDGPGRIAVLFRDVTVRQRAEAALRASEERQIFLLKLSDALRLVDDPLRVMERACMVLGQELGADRVNYAEVEGEEYIVRQEFRRDGLASMKGRYPIDSFRSEERAAFEAGRTVAIPDVEAAMTASEAAAYLSLDTRAFLATPLVKGDRLVGVLSVIRAGVHDWTESERALVLEVAERTWAAVERARVEEALRDREANLRVLVAELQHRVRNILTVTRLTFARTFEGEGSREEVAEHFKGRLDAMARTQVLLTQGVERTADLEEMIRDELLSVGVSDGENVTIDGPETLLNHTVAEALGMALHELTTNALKYGALKVPGASLAVRWRTNIGESNARRLDLEWVEQGVPAVPVRPGRQGFGRELIEEALPYRLGAETKLAFGGGGVRCSISVPLPAGEADAVPDGTETGA